jgi:hypothetical protein
MNFSDLQFRDSFIDGATIAEYTFTNGWAVEVAAGPKGCGLYGTTGTVTFAVAIIRPSGARLNDMLHWQTPVQITSIMRIVSML